MLTSEGLGFWLEGDVVCFVFPKWLYNLILGGDDRICKKFNENINNNFFCVNEERLVS